MLGQSKKEEPENAAVNYNLAISLIELGGRLRARQHLEKAINLDPGIVDAHVLLGSVQTQLGEFELASKSYATAIRLNPDKLDAIGGLAFTNIKLHKGQQAYELIKHHKVTRADVLLQASHSGRCDDVCAPCRGTYARSLTQIHTRARVCANLQQQAQPRLHGS